ncbi:uncharacterized protein [Amphiura filiformis]|uniref:uncharacterized protein n=1 Tax=Amphiura filiformis TaxID=82378 RepID=UPI003B22426D
MTISMYLVIFAFLIKLVIVYACKDMDTSQRYTIIWEDNEHKTWQDAQDYCLSKSGNLATIETQEELDYIAGQSSELYNKDFWIGLNDIENEGTLQWVGAPESNVSNFEWSTGESNHLTKDCVHLKNGGQLLNYASCIDDSKGFICEATHRCKSDYYAIDPNRHLVNHVIRSFVCESMMACAKHCLSENNCLSLNFYQETTSGLSMCDLNSENHLSRPDDFVYMYDTLSTYAAPLLS